MTTTGLRHLSDRGLCHPPLSQHLSLLLTVLSFTLQGLLELPGGPAYDVVIGSIYLHRTGQEAPTLHTPLWLAISFRLNLEPGTPHPSTPQLMSFLPVSLTWPECPFLQLMARQASNLHSEISLFTNLDNGVVLPFNLCINIFLLCSDTCSLRTRIMSHSETLYTSQEPNYEMG